MRFEVFIKSFSFITLIILLAACKGSDLIDTPLVYSNEVVMTRWSPDHVWIPGHYEFKEGEYYWVKGKFNYEPRYRTGWVPAHKRKTSRGKIWFEERWK